MRNLADALEAVDATVAKALRSVFDRQDIRGDDDDGLLDAAAVAARIIRRVEGALVEITGDVVERDGRRLREDRLPTTYGCRSLNELLQRVTLSSPRTVAGYERGARGVHRAVGLSSGEMLPADLPALRAALLDGAIGAEGLDAVAGCLNDLRHAVGHGSVLLAEAQLAAAATGSAGAPPVGVADLRLLGQVLAAYLDPDGAEPRDELARRKRGLTLGMARDGLIPIRGNLLPDVAGQLQRISDSLLNPKLDGPRFLDSEDHRDEQAAAVAGQQADPRSRAQKLHDVLATILTVAARTGDLPTIGGAAPTLVVSVRAEDFAAGSGPVTVDGVDEPASMDVARHAACCGSIERVAFGVGGRILSLGVTDRIFTHAQRKAIVLRDGGCLIPGCHVPAGWCELHHVEEHSRGGPTHTDNGALLCWWHHRGLGTSGWEVRMNHGVPEIRGPGWWDPHRRWRSSTKSVIRQRDLLTVALRR